MPRKPLKRQSSPIAERIRAARDSLRGSGKPSSLEDIAAAMRETGVAASPSYLSLIENGIKVPSEKFAEALAQVLGEDVELFRGWARLKGHSQASEFASAAALIKQRLPGGLLSDPGVTKEWLKSGDIRFISAGQGLQVPRHALLMTEGPARFEPPALTSTFSVPLFKSLSDWDGKSQPVGFLRVSPRHGQRLKVTSESFAFVVTDELARRVRSRGIGAGLLAIASRKIAPLEMGEIYVVRHEGQLFLSHVWWDQRILVLLPDDADGDLIRVEVREPVLHEHVLGQVALVDRGAVKDLEQVL